MEIVFQLVSKNPDPVEAQAENNAFLRQGTLNPDGSAVKVLYTGPVEGSLELIDEEQLVALAYLDMRYMGARHIYKLANVEVYANGAINVFVKDVTTGLMSEWVCIRPSKAEQEHYDRLAEEHGEA